MACNVFHACTGGWFGSERIFHVAANSYTLVSLLEPGCRRGHHPGIKDQQADSEVRKFGKPFGTDSDRIER